MPIRKTDGKWTVRRQIRYKFRNKSEALQFNAILESAVAEAGRRLPGTAA